MYVHTNHVHVNVRVSRESNKTSVSPSLDLLLLTMATEVRRAALGEEGSDELAVIKSAIDALSSRTMSRLRTSLSVKGHIVPAKVGGRGSVLPPIAATFCLGRCDDDVQRAIYVSQLVPIYGLMELRDEEDRHDVVTHVRVHVDTDEAAQMGVQLLEVLELETGEKDKTEAIGWTILVLFEAPADAWERIHLWKRAFGITLACGHALRTPFYTTYALNSAATESVSLSFKRRHALASRGYVALHDARVDKWDDRWFSQELPRESGLSYRSRLTTCVPRLTEAFGILQGHSCRHDDSYRFDRIVNSGIDEERNAGAVYLIDEAGMNVRAIREIVCSDAFAAQLVEDAEWQDPPSAPRPPSFHLPAVGSATATGIVASWVDDLLSKCARDLDCVCKMHDFLLTPRLLDW